MGGDKEEAAGQEQVKDEAGGQAGCGDGNAVYDGARMMEDYIGHVHCDDCEKEVTGNLDWCACPCHHDTYPPDEIAESYKYKKEDEYVPAEKDTPKQIGD